MIVCKQAKLFYHSDVEVGVSQMLLMEAHVYESLITVHLSKFYSNLLEFGIVDFREVCAIVLIR